MARIKIDLERQIGTIDRNIYGNFVEHLGRCIYGGIYDEGSHNVDADYFRLDVLNAVNGLSIPVLRWPGGNFVSGYHWMDGVGPKEGRPRKLELAWGSVESNRFGTDEYIKYCHKIGAEPYICVNMGNGTLEEAQNWVEYCNGTTDSHYANLRRENGYIAPHKVKFWGLGNEVYGEWQIGHKSAEDYAKLALEYAKVMKWVDPSIKLIVCGADSPDWNRVVLERLGQMADYISLHMYAGNQGDDYYEYMATSERIERKLRSIRGVIDSVSYKLNLDRQIHVAFDEWNVWYRTPCTPNLGNTLEERYDLEDALVVAMFLNSFIRNSDLVKMANMAQLVNVIAPIFTSKDDMFLQTIYYPLELYSNHNGDIALDAYTQSETYEVNGNEVSYLDVSVTLDAVAGTVCLNVINKHFTDFICTTIENQSCDLGPHVDVFSITASDIKTENSFEKKDAVKTRVEEREVSGNEFVYSFPPYSITMLKSEVRRK